ncbi:MAG: AIR synthase-related protein, partial [Synergistaceae bacterium]|nr:AIR synthase-related protein [Synergistaceae bacterium]
VIMGALIGTADRVLKATDIRTGDALLATKHVGIEGMSILAADRSDLLSGFMSGDDIKELLSWAEMTSVLKESRAVCEYAKFMHDPTEGGFMGGIGEICSLSGLEAVLDNDAIPIHPLTRLAALKLGFDPLHLIASGSLLIVVPQERLDEAHASLSADGIDSHVVGRMGGRLKDKVPDPDEELWRLLKMEAVK